MTSGLRISGWVLISALFLLVSPLAQANTFRVATYNVENYLDRPTESRRVPKSEAAKAKVREQIRAIGPDVLALQEMGATNALLELRSSLKAEGMDFPYWEHVRGWDTNIHVAILSRFPITASRPRTNEAFLLSGRRLRVSRGFAEVDIRVNDRYSFTLITAHLKSKRPVPQADESEMRLEEARLLRRLIDNRLAANPNANVVILGDFNDTRNSASIRMIIGQGRTRLIDTRPAEKNGDTAPAATPSWEPRNVAWTHYYGVEDLYSRIDYILVSPGMAREWVKEGTYVSALANWGIGSDHRPLVATFRSSDL